MKLRYDTDLVWLEGPWTEVAKAFVGNLYVNLFFFAGGLALFGFLMTLVIESSVNWIAPVNVLFAAGIAALYTIYEVPLKRLRHKSVKEKTSLAAQVALMRKEKRKKG